MRGKPERSVQTLAVAYIVLGIAIMVAGFWVGSSVASGPLGQGCSTSTGSSTGSTTGTSTGECCPGTTSGTSTGECCPGTTSGTSTGECPREPPCPPRTPTVLVRWHYSPGARSSHWSHVGTASCATITTLGPQALRAGLKIRPHTEIGVGYDFKLPQKGNTFTVSFTRGEVVFKPRCVSGRAPSQQSFAVPLPDKSYIATTSSWYPSAKARSHLVYQGSGEAPNPCEGGPFMLSEGGTFSTFVSVH